MLKQVLGRCRINAYVRVPKLRQLSAANESS
jgi:hypothetical protein